MNDLLVRLSNMRAAVQHAQDDMSLSALESSIRMLVRTIESGGRIWVGGNGGSCANANHFAADLTCRGLGLTANRVFATSLCESSSTITAISNDYGWTQLYRRQINSLVGSTDCLIVFSVLSGSIPEREPRQSMNLLLGLQSARARGCSTIGILGASGGSFAEWCDISICLRSSESWVVEPVQSTVSHFLVEGVISALG